MKRLNIKPLFPLECGKSLAGLTIAYCSYGKLNRKKDNVIWIAHALTANADAADWWAGLVGEDKLFDPKNYFIVCANMLGSCYGSTGPGSIDPATGKAYEKDFPLITIRDMVKAHQLLQEHLGIGKIYLAIGGSMGGQQLLEWAVSKPDLFEHLCVLATNAQHSPWGIAFNEAQRMAIEADPTLLEASPAAGKRGLQAARAIGMLSYRNYQAFQETQSEEKQDKLNDFRASSYQRYQGRKLQNRFNVFSYLSLSKAMDSHNLGRNRGGTETALGQIKAKTLVIGVQSDVLFPLEEQMFIADNIPAARFEVIDSKYGHDGFLIEHQPIQRLVESFLRGQPYRSKMANYRLRKSLQELANKGTIALPGTERF